MTNGYIGPFVFTERTHGPVYDPSVMYSLTVHPNMFIVEYLNVYISSNPNDDVFVAIRDQGTPGVYTFAPSQVKSGFILNTLVKIPIFKAMTITIGRHDFSTPNTADPMTVDVMVTGSLQPQP